MLLQLSEIREIQFLLCLTIIIIGTQLGFFFFYRYHKINAERLQLNKILLSYGSICLLSIISAFISIINRFFISSPYLKEILDKLGYILLFFSIIIFLYFMTSEEFSKIIKLNIVKVLIILVFIPIILVILIPTNALIFSIIKIIVIALYLALFGTFQTRLVIKARGKIKKHLFQILIGGIIYFGSLFFVIEIFINLLYPFENSTSLLFLSTVSFIAGFIIILSGIFSFPAFFELNWEENLLDFFIINQHNNISLYRYNFSGITQEMKKNKGEDDYNQDDFIDTFSSYITGIDDIIAEITNTANEKINKIKREDSLIFLEYGSSNIAYVLITKKDLNSNLYFLYSLKKQCESIFKEVLIDVEDFEGKEELFKSFDIIIDNFIKGD